MKVLIERNLRGKFIDILLELESGDFIAIEVSTTTSAGQEKENIIKDFRAGCSFVITAFKDPVQADKLKKILESFESKKRKRIGICLLPQLLKCRKLSDVIKSEYLLSKGL